MLLIPFIDRPVRGRPARAVHRGPEPDDDHQGQRADQHRLPDLLADRRPAQERGRTSQDFAGALQGVATTTLRAVIGDILLDDVLSKRDQINEVLRAKLDELTERWGGKVTTVEIREITPPRDVQDAMNRQLSAERTRRAVITESEGARQAAINVAEGQKQSEILKAEGERQAAILRAEGFSEALTRIFNAATGVDEKTMTLQYLEALKAIGASPSTKYVIPIEFTRLLEPIREYIAPAVDDGGDGRRQRASALDAGPGSRQVEPPAPTAG